MFFDRTNVTPAPIRLYTKYPSTAEQVILGRDGANDVLVLGAVAEEDVVLEIRHENCPR